MGRLGRYRYGCARLWTRQAAGPGRPGAGPSVAANHALAQQRLALGEPLPPELVDFHLLRKFMAAQALYEPRPYPGPMVLFKASDCETQYLQAGPLLGWDRHIQGGISVTPIGGSHFSMMNEPGVLQLIEGIRRELARLDAPAGAPASERSAAMPARRRWVLPG